MIATKQKYDSNDLSDKKIDIEDTIRKIVEQSTTPFEKLNHNQFVQGQTVGTDVYNKYYEYWKKVLSSNGSNEKIERFLKLSDLEKEDLHQMFAPAKLAIKAKLPDWANILYKILTAEKVNNIEIESKNLILFEEVTILFEEVFEKEFNKVLSDIEGVITSIAFKKIKHHIKCHCSAVLTKVLYHEFKTYLNQIDNSKIYAPKNEQEKNFYLLFVQNILSDNCRALFRKYPMLARILANDISNQIIFLKEFIQRVRQDKEDLKKHFRQKKLGKIIDLKLNLSDAHNGGQGVIILTFETGFRVVYKPRSIEIGKAFNHFCTWVNNKLDSKLKTLKQFSKQNYGWIEFVENTPCKNEIEVKRYYERAGILLGITYFLESTDYHEENLIAAGSQPVLIDHETVIHPYFFLGKSSNINANKVNGIPLDSVLRSYLLPFRNKATDNITTCGYGSQEVHNRIINRAEYFNPNTDKMYKQVVRQKHELSANLPKLNGEIQHLGRYTKDFLQGFKILYELVEDTKTELIAENSPLNVFNKIPLRLIFRNTQVYATILDNLLSPRYLNNANYYGFRIELLARALIKDDEKPNFWDILQEERAEMLNRDIPCIAFVSDSTNIFLSNHKPIRAYFKADCLTSIKNKINRTGKEDYDREVAIICSSLNLD